MHTIEKTGDGRWANTRRAREQGLYTRAALMEYLLGAHGPRRHWANVHESVYGDTIIAGGKRVL